MYLNQMQLEWLNSPNPYVQYCHISKAPELLDWFRRQLQLLVSVIKAAPQKKADMDDAPKIYTSRKTQIQGS